MLSLTLIGLRINFAERRRISVVCAVTENFQSNTLKIERGVFMNAE
jgi:hypothetical protein